VSSRVQTAVTMQRVSMNIGEVVRGMDVAMSAMDLEKVCSWLLHEAMCLCPDSVYRYRQ
jgi:hypothetical protein